MVRHFSYVRPFASMPKQVVSLAASGALYITNLDKNGKKMADATFRRHIKEAEEFFLFLFGGYTTFEQGRGAFRLGGRVLRERTVRVVSFSPKELFVRMEPRLKEWIARKKKEWNQKTIAFEFEGDLYYL